VLLASALKQVLNFATSEVSVQVSAQMSVQVHVPTAIVLSFSVAAIISLLMLSGTVLATSTLWDRLL
jgi:hypothetical protein